MAVIHRAELTPSKPEVLTSWVPRQPWFAGDPAAPAEVVGSYRFDDPAGEVGIESFLVRFGDGPTLHVPFTYRDAPLTGGPEPVDTLEHSVLGRRWVYDGPFDPVYVAAVTTAILTGGTEAALESPDGTLWPSRGTARGSGSRTAGVAEPTRLVVTTDKGLTSVVSDGFTLAVRRVVDPQAHTDDLRLTGTWAGTDEPVLLATVRLTA